MQHRHDQYSSMPDIRISRKTSDPRLTHIRSKLQSTLSILSDGISGSRGSLSTVEQNEELDEQYVGMGRAMSTPSLNKTKTKREVKESNMTLAQSEENVREANELGGKQSLHFNAASRSLCSSFESLNHLQKTLLATLEQGDKILETNEVEMLKMEIEELKHNFASLHSENQELKEQTEAPDIKDKFKDILDQLKRSTMMLEEKNNLITQLTVQTQNDGSTISKLRKQNTKMAVLHSESVQKLWALRRENEMLLSMVEDSKTCKESEVKMCNNRIEALETELEQKDVELRMLQDKVSQLMEKLDDKELREKRQEIWHPMGY